MSGLTLSACSRRLSADSEKKEEKVSVHQFGLSNQTSSIIFVKKDGIKKKRAEKKTWIIDRFMFVFLYETAPVVSLKGREKII